MTYGDHIPAFQRELDLLSREPVTLRFPGLMALLRHEGTTEADAAVRAFVATRLWPPVSDSCRVELCLRLSCALWWLTEQRAEDPEGQDVPKLADSLLREYWRDVGRVDWLYENLVKDWAKEHGLPTDDD